jgi:small subunit ribosomal protein S15
MASIASLRCLLAKPHVASKVSTNGLAMWGKPSLVPAVASSIASHPSTNHQQIRTALTKTKKRQREKMKDRELRVSQGLPAKPNPPKYINKNKIVINAMTRHARDDESKRFDTEAAQEMKGKMGAQSQKEENMRFMFDGLVMSDRVRKLFELNNGSQREVVTSQKRRGMELFQEREGDTGSSAVQVVALTTRIQQLQTHIAKHHKDKSTKRGLDALYVRRRKVLDYMERKDFESYRKVVKSLGLVR